MASQYRGLMQIASQAQDRGLSDAEATAQVLAQVQDGASGIPRMVGDAQTLVQHVIDGRHDVRSAGHFAAHAVALHMALKARCDAESQRSALEVLGQVAGHYADTVVACVSQLEPSVRMVLQGAGNDGRQLRRGLAAVRPFVVALTAQGCPYVTSLHADYISACARAQMYHLVEDVPSDRLVDVSPSACAPHMPTDVLRFFYGCGVCHASLGQWAAAREAFLAVLLVPAARISVYMVDAYKRLALVHVLDRLDALRDLPAVPDPDVVRMVPWLCAPYVEFSQAVARPDLAAATALAEKHRALWAADRTSGLVRRALAEALPRKRLLRMARAHGRVALDAAADELRAGDVRAFLMDLMALVRERRVCADVDLRARTVSFRPLAVRETARCLTAAVTRLQTSGAALAASAETAALRYAAAPLPREDSPEKDPLLESSSTPPPLQSRSSSSRRSLSSYLHS